ncbi:pentapeptide repeat-containing protein [Mycobacterium simiae]
MFAGWQALGRPRVARNANEIPTEVFLDLLKLSLTIVAGVGGIVALVVAYRKQRLGEAQHQREESAARREHQKMYAERFSKASELLGSERSAVRLAGIYALASLADDWESGRQTCIDVLCAYLRMPHKPLNDPPIDGIKERDYRPSGREAWRSALLETSMLDPSEEHQVRSTIIRVIVEHLNSNADTPWFGHNFNLSGAVLDSPSFAGTHFYDCYFDFGEALLYGEIDFSGSKFLDSKLSFFFTTISGSCGFEICDFKDTEIDLSADIIGGIKFYASSMEETEVTVSGLDLDGADFSFMEINMTKNSKLEIWRADVNKSSLAFSRCHVTESKIAIRSATLTDSSMYFSGMRIGSGGRVFLASGIHNKIPSPMLTDSKIHLNDVGIDAGGFFGFQRQNFVRTPLHFPYLNVNRSEFVLTECSLESSPVTFYDAQLSERSRLVVDACSDDPSPIDTDGLSQSCTDEELLVVIRSGTVDDIDPSSWAESKTRQDVDVDPALRSHIVSWY